MSTIRMIKAKDIKPEMVIVVSGMVHVVAKAEVYLPHTVEITPLISPMMILLRPEDPILILGSL